MFDAIFIVNIIGTSIVSKTSSKLKLQVKILKIKMEIID